VLRDGEARLSGRHARLPLRLVASSTRDLDADVRDGRFRQDLLRRLAACRIAVPPLRHRASDIAAIVEQLSAVSGAPRSFTQPAITVLSALPWTGNLDELAAVLERALQSAGPIVTQEDVLAHLPIDGPFLRFDLTASLRDARRRFERDYIAAVLERHQWRMSEAARALGIERANLYRKTRQLGIIRVPRADVS
jgi:two-component system nitrogen regulation response regulator NtrX